MKKSCILLDVIWNFVYMNFHAFGNAPIANGITVKFQKSTVSNRICGTKNLISSAKKRVFNKLAKVINKYILTHCGRVMQICVFNTVKLGTSASSPQCHSASGNVSRGITPSSTTRVFGEYFLKISVHKSSQRIYYKFLKKHSIKVD